MSLQSITNQINKYLSSNKGKEKVAQRLREYAVKGVTKTKGGSSIFSEKLMKQAVEDLKALIVLNYLEADATGSSGSSTVFTHVSHMVSDAPVVVGDHYEVGLFFSGDLSRPSLDSDTYGGIGNIVALINNGYTAQNTVYGWWDGHSRQEGSDLSHGIVEGSVWIPSRRSRAATYFIQNAVNEFNAKYAAYGISAVPADIYTEDETYVNRTWRGMTGQNGAPSFTPSRSSRP